MNQNKQPKSLDEKFVISLQKKREYFKQSKACVESLLETNISETILLEKVRCISQSDYQDVVEERAIVKICGYAICNNSLGRIPIQKYRISTTLNKVYDITERKNFCSNGCYKASCYLKEQIPTSPVWLRENEDYSTIHLLPTRGTIQGPLGKEVLLDLKKVSIHESKIVENATTVLSFAHDALEELEKIGGQCYDTMHIHEHQIQTQKSSDTSAEQIMYESESTEGEIKVTEPKLNNNDQIKIQKEIDENTEQIIWDSDRVAVEENKKFTQITLHNEFEFSGRKTSVASYSVKTCRTENANVPGTHNILVTDKKEQHFVDQNVSSSVSEASDCLDSLKKKSENVARSVRQKLDSSIPSSKTTGSVCSFRVDHIERTACEWFTKSSLQYIIGESTALSSFKTEMQTNKPSDEMLKVSAFYSGTVSAKGSTKYDNKSVVLPAVEKYEQKCVRQKIVLDKLSKILPDILIIFGVNDDITTEVRGLIETFHLNAHNITMKPNEWNLMGLLILKLLSNKNLILKNVFARKKSKNRLSQMLRSLHLESMYLDTFVFKLFSTQMSEDAQKTIS